MKIDFEELNLVELRDSLKTLREEIETDLKNDPTMADDAIPLLTSIVRLQKGLSELKGSEEEKKKKFLECVPDLAFVMNSMNEFEGEEYDDEYDDEDFDDEVDDEDLTFADEDEK